MGLAHNEVQVKWDGTDDFDTITSVANVTSEAMALTATAIARTIMLKSDMTTGTPAAGDYTHFYALPTLGDPDGSGSDEYPTDGNDPGALFLCTVDHNAQDPAIGFVVLPIPMKGIKVYAETEGLDGGDIVTISATILETTST